jgi:hypothetical protein
MNRLVAFVPAMLLVCGVGTSLAMPIVGGQTAGARSRSESIQAARGDVEAERGELQAPRTAEREHRVGATRAHEMQAPRAQDVQAPRSYLAQAPRTNAVKEPRLRED